MNTIRGNLTEILVSFALYWVFAGYLWFFPELKSGPITYFIFLPAGVKLFAILIFRWRGAVGTGLAIFSRLMLTDSDQPWVSWLIVAVTVTITLYLVVELGLRIFKVENDLSNLSYFQIVAIATAGSIINGYVFAYVVNGLDTSQMSGGLFHSGFMGVIGNFAGNAIFVCVAVVIVRQQKRIKQFIAHLNR